MPEFQSAMDPPVDSQSDGSPPRPSAPEAVSPAAGLEAFRFNHHLRAISACPLWFQ